MIERTCCICGVLKPIDQFNNRKDRPHGKGYRCKPCKRKKGRDHYKNPIIIKEKSCPECNKSFIVTHKNHKYCTTACNTRSQKRSNKHKFFTSMLNPKRKKDGLTHTDLEQAWKQQKGLCALSGIPLTMKVGQGGSPTNVSIDRLNAGGEYTKKNIQLVCKAVNSFRNNLSIREFRWWCQRVVDNIPLKE